MKKTIQKLLLMLALLANAQTQLHAQGTAFTYQGRLNFNGNPAAGSFDLRSAVFDTNSVGNQVSVTLTNIATPVTNGLFAVTLDFGPGIFTGPARWLEISTRTNGPGTFTTLTPRQALTATPYAVFAGGASNLLGSLPASQVSGTISPTQLPANVVTNTETGVTLGGTFTGNGGGLSNLNASALASGTVPANVLAGFQAPFYATVGGGQNNTANNSYAVVSGGYNNTAGYQATVPGGSFNVASGFYSFAAGQRAKALHQGAFVWADSQAADFSSTANDQFLIRAQGGVGIGTNVTTGNALTVAGRIAATGFTGDGSGLTNLNGGNIIGGTITGSQLAPDAVTATNIASNSITAGQLAAGAAAANLNASGQSGVASGGAILSANPNSTALAAAGYTLLGTTVLPDFWQSRSGGNAPGPRTGPSGVWSGSELIVWGGYLGGNFVATNLNDGGRYNPASNIWTAITLTGAPAPRNSHTAVWTGTEMIVWGGLSNGTYFANGGRYNPASNTWINTALTGAPAGRYNQTAVWTGTQMLVWGGFGTAGYLNTGAKYNPITDTWTPISTIGAPAGREYHTAVWTGTEMLIYGGITNVVGLDYQLDPLVYRYNPLSDTWTHALIFFAPANRAGQSGVWSGTEMIVWGGYDTFGNVLNDGGRFNPATSVWTPLPTANAPMARWGAPAVWSGTEMILADGSGTSTLADGGQFSPGNNGWMPTALTGAPPARAYDCAVWDGNEMLVFGGAASGANVLPLPASLNDVWSYTPSRTLYIYSKP